MEEEQEDGQRGAELLSLMLTLSERAGNIARRIRKDDHLIELLTQQKGSDEANPRFVQDFKTLADVLIQETVRHYIGEKVGNLSDKRNLTSNEMAVELIPSNSYLVP